MTDWLTTELRQEIRQTFEPRYKRELTDEEVVDLAQNLVGLVETFTQYKCSQNMNALKN